LARLLKLPNVMKPLESAGVAETGPASGEGV